MEVITKFHSAGSIVLIVSPSRESDGRKAHGNRGQLFDARLDGRTLVARSTQPLLDASRILIGEGVGPTARIVMRHEGQSYDALRSTVGAAARLTVKDDSVGKPVFRPWAPYAKPDGLPAVLGKAPMRQTEGAATPLGPPAGERLHEFFGAMTAVLHLGNTIASGHVDFLDRLVGAKKSTPAFPA